MEDGKHNIRYILLDMTHSGYIGFINYFRALHTQKEIGNKLTILPNIANTQAIVKVVAHIGWVQEEAVKINFGVPVLAVHPYEELNQVYAYLASNKWPKLALI